MARARARSPRQRLIRREYPDSCRKSTGRSRRLHSLRFSRADLQEVRHHSSTLQLRVRANCLVCRIRLGNTFDDETRIEQQVEPLAQRSRKARHAERWELVTELVRRGAEDPLVENALLVREIISDLHRH